MNQLQAELNAETTLRPVRILGINEAGQESGNATIVAGRVLPWLQDTVSVNVWQQWQVTYRDVIVLDAENKRITAFNVTNQDLSNADNYAALKAILLEAANRSE